MIVDAEPSTRVYVRLYFDGVAWRRQGPDVRLVPEEDAILELQKLKRLN